MAFVIIEREFESPFTLEQVYGAEDGARWCMRMYGAHVCLHFLARDGLRLVCVFDAPDAEAMRNVTRQMNYPTPRHLWSATFHPAPDGRKDDLDPDASRSGELVVVERTFPAPVTFEEVDEIEADGIPLQPASCALCLQLFFVRPTAHAVLLRSPRCGSCPHRQPHRRTAFRHGLEHGHPCARSCPGRITNPR